MQFTGVAVANEEGQLLTMWSEVHQLWTVPGGKLDMGENHIEAAKRELEEETGVACLSCHMVHREPSTLAGIRGVHDMSLFEATEWFGDPRIMEPNKHSDMAWRDIEVLRTLEPKSILLSVAERILPNGG